MSTNLGGKGMRGLPLLDRDFLTVEKDIGAIEVFIKNRVDDFLVEAQQRSQFIINIF